MVRQFVSKTVFLCYMFMLSMYALLPQPVEGIQNVLTVAVSHDGWTAQAGDTISDHVSEFVDTNESGAVRALTHTWNVNPRRRHQLRHHQHSMIVVGSRLVLASLSIAAQFRAAISGTVIVVIVVVLCVLGIPALIIALMALLIKCNSAAARAFSFFWNMYPIAVAYKKKVRSLPPDLMDEEREEALEELHRMYAPKAREFVQTYKGAAIKASQFLSTQRAVPDTWRTELSKCHDSCHPMSFQEVRQVVENALKKPLEFLFKPFEEEPLAVASIGQVHRARLVEEDVDVVVKVKLSGVEELFALDYCIIKNFARFAWCTGVPIPNWMFSFFDATYQMIQNELNYTNEVRNTELMRQRLVPQFGSSIQVPPVYSKYCTKDILTMGFVKGVKVDRVARESIRALGLPLNGINKPSGADATGKARCCVAGLLGTRWCCGRRLRFEVIVDLLLTVARTRARVSGRCGRLCCRSPDPLEQAEASRIAEKMDVKNVIDRLFDVWGFSILEAGVFNCDPHPGNILSQQDGTLGLIDYGQVVTLDLESRRKFARFIVAVADGDEQGCKDAMKELEWKTSWMPNVQPKPGTSHEWEWAQGAFGNQLPSQTAQMEQMEGNLLFMGRVVLILKGLAMCFGHRVCVSKMWRKYALRVLTLPM